MAIQQVQIPQIGEGLQEARVVGFLKQPGDAVKRDEPIYQMETDKAVMDVESPVAGTIVRWLAQADDVLAIGAAIVEIDTADAVAAPAAHAAPVPAPAAPTSASADNVVSVRIPQIGEGLQEARLVAFLKQPGDRVKRDEPIYQMETDKAVMDVESPYEGTLIDWLAPVDTVMPIGGEVARMHVAAGVQEAGGGHGAPADSQTHAISSPVQTGGQAATSDIRGIPPRTRAYAKEKGVADEALVAIKAAGSKLMPSDIDAFLAGGAKVAAPVASANFVERPVASKQRVLNSRMVRGNALVVPGTISVAVNWEPIESLRARYKAGGGEFQPSTFTMFAFCVAQVLKDFPEFRTTMIGDDTYRTYNHANLGIAVALEGGELVIAVVEDADTLAWHGFAAEARAKIALGRDGKDQANESVTISLTNMQNYGLRDAVPVVVPPSVATLFIGEVYNGLVQNTDELKMQRTCNLGLTFDHRVLNGAAAANFMQAIKNKVEGIDEVIAL